MGNFIVRFGFRVGFEVLGSVVRDWRRIVWSTPYVWNTDWQNGTHSTLSFLILIENPWTHTETLSVPNCAVCSKLDGHIVEARRAMEHASEQRRADLEEVNRDCDPIQRLPAEVASSIFVLCLPRLPSLDIFDVTPKTGQDDIAIQAVQFLLGSICRHWRRIAWSTPHLWNILWLQISNRITVTHSQMVADGLRRSGLYISMSMDLRDQ